MHCAVQTIIEGDNMKNNTANRVISIMLMMFIIIELTLSSSIGIVYGISNNGASGNAPEDLISEENVKDVGENYRYQKGGVIE